MIASNEYFDGKVKSLGFQSEEGRSTVGVISAGDYEFSTDSYEYMTIISGELDVLFPDEEEWMKVVSPETFEVEPNASFKVKATADVAYMCLYTDSPLPDFELDEEDEGCGCGCN